MKKEELKKEEWKQEISDLETFFAGIDLPVTPVRLNRFTTINSVKTFLDTHFATVKANAGNPTFLPYLCRLQELRDVLAVPQNCGTAGLKIIGIPIIVLLFAALSACSGTKLSKSEHVTEQSVQFRTQIQTQIDSVLVYKHDSIYIKEKNDTVLIEKWHTKIAYRDRLRVDTLRLVDTVSTTVSRVETVEKEVNRITGWQWTQIYAGRIFMGIVLLFAVYLIFKLKE